MLKPPGAAAALPLRLLQRRARVHVKELGKVVRKLAILKIFGTIVYSLIGFIFIYLYYT